MSQEQMSPEEIKEVEDLAGLVAEALQNGESPDDVKKQLTDNGWETQEADEFVNSIAWHLNQAQHQAETSSGGGGGMGWLLWIGGLLLINLLSWMFDWPFWVY